MAAFVKSIEKFQLTLGAGVGSATGLLTKGQNIANCVPFISSQVTTVNTGSEGETAQYLVDADFSDSTHVRVATGVTAVRALSVEVQVVEFLPALVKVQQLTFTLPAGDGYEFVAPGDNIVEAKTFPYTTWQSASGGSAATGRYNVRTRIDGVDNIGFETGVSTTRVITGHCYLIEAQNTEFAVTESNVGVASGQTVTDSFTAVTEAKSAVFGSYKTSNTGFANENHTVDISLDSGGAGITGQRDGTSGRIDGAWYTVEFSGNENVYRGTLTGQGATSPYTDTISTAVVMANSTVHTAGHGMPTSGSFPGSATTDVPDAMCALTISTTTQVSIAHDTTGGEASNDISWEVIEWDVVAAPAASRRVWVVS